MQDLLNIAIITLVIYLFSIQKLKISKKEKKENFPYYPHLELTRINLLVYNLHSYAYKILRSYHLYHIHLPKAVFWLFIAQTGW